MSIMGLFTAVIMYMAFTLSELRVVAEVTFKDTPTNVFAVVGDTARLPCIITGLGTKTVVWKNKETSDVYSVGRFIFTDDRRFMLSDTSSFDDWGLMIRDSMLSDQGTYICVVDTKLTPYAREIQLTILSPPRITSSSPASQTVRSGESVKLYCLTEGVPPQIVQWYEIGLQGRNSVGMTETLHIPNITGFSGGEYQGYREYECLVDTGVPPAMSRQFRVNVRTYTPILQLTTPSDTSVPTGSDVAMTVRCMGNPMPLVQWYHGEESLNQGGDRYTFETLKGNLHSLTIKGVNEDEFGLYRIHCTNGFGRAEAVFQIQQMVTPEIDLTRSSGNKTMYLGDSLEMSCYSTSERAKFSWYKSEDLDIDRTSEIPVGSGNTLSIEVVQASDAGLYVCMTGNMAGFTTHHIGVSILGRAHGLSTVHGHVHWCYPDVVSSDVLICICTVVFICVFT